MKIQFKSGNTYFDTYYIYDEQGKIVGIIEDHCRGVEQRYFVGWKLKGYIAGQLTGDTKVFDTKEEAMLYSVGEVVTE